MGQKEKETEMDGKRQKSDKLNSNNISRSDSRRKKQKMNKQKEKKIVAKALDGQRYPCPAE